MRAALRYTAAPMSCHADREKGRRMTIVDRHSPNGRSALRAEQRIAKLTVFAPFVATLAAIGLAVTGIAVPSPWVLVETALLYVLTVLGVTIGFHRLFTHGSFAAPRAVRAALAILGCMAAQGPPAFWVALHRAHHRYSDRPRDPHSPHFSTLEGDASAGIDIDSGADADAGAQTKAAPNSAGPQPAEHKAGAWGGLWHAHVAWMFEPLPNDWPSFVGDLLHDRHLGRIGAAYGWWVLAGIVAPALAAGLIGHSILDAAVGGLWGGLVRIFLVHHATWSVNSLCHLFGARSFETHDHSRNNAFVALLTAGEGWHNNHHAFPTSARHGLKWWQLDLSYAVICCLGKLGLATRIRTAPSERGAP
jgi:stearoyl-CoA desaturase (delta-9 desaturase)